MNSNGTTKRLSNATYQASQAKKKAKKNDDRYEKQWEALGPYLRMANKTELTNLAKTLFRELYKRDGRKVGSDILSSLIQKHKMNKNHLIADSVWEFNNANSKSVSLIFEDGLETLAIEGHDSGYFEVAELQLTTRNDRDVLDYKGEAEGSEGELKMYVSLKYYPKSDTIKGSVKAERRGVPAYYGRIFAEEFAFTANRSDESDPDSE